MPDQTSDLHRAKRGGAILATCVVHTLNESDPSFRERFLERLTLAYRILRDDTAWDALQEMEPLTWTREYLTGFGQITGQGEPFFKD
jgi:hypothetical protein